MNHIQEVGGLCASRVKKKPQRDNIAKWGKPGDDPVVPRRLIDIREASLYIGLQVDTIYRMVSQRRIPYLKVGRRTMFDVRLLDEWLDQHTVLPTAQRGA